jgi:ribokinase
VPAARIVVVGSTNIDLVVQAPRIPRPGETVLGGEFRTVDGGKGANQAVAAARLGAEVNLVARIGADAFGDRAQARFQEEGIRTEYLVREEEAPHGVALILVDQHGENAIAVAPGANARLSPDDVDAAEPTLAACDAVLLQLEVPLATVSRAVELARRHRRMVILNPAPYTAVPPGLLAGVDYLTPNETEAEMLLGGGAAGLGGVAPTAQRPGEQVHVPGRRVRAVDTTGAGDAFSGALAVSLAEGRPFREAVRFAICASALAVTRFGAQSSLPTRAEVEAALAGE